MLLTTVVKDRFAGTLCSEATGPNTMIKISSLTLKFLSGFYGTVYLCVWDGGATTGVRCVWWWGEGVNVFNCFGQLSKSKLQQMEVKFKTD